MKHVIARLLRDRTPWQLVAIATVTSAAGLAFVLEARPSTVRSGKLLVVIVFSTAASALIFALLQRSKQIEQAGARGQAGRWWARFLGGIAAIAATTVFVSYSLGVYGGQMYSSCNAVAIHATHAERTAALAEARAGLTSPLSWLPRLFGNRARIQCDAVAADFARVEQGLCPYFAIVDRPCRCGDRVLAEAGCEEPSCYYDEGKPDVFRCPGQDIPEGYSGSPTAPVNAERLARERRP